MTADKRVALITGCGKENGIGAAIIRAPERDLQALCKSAYRLGWMLETYHETFNIKREPRMTRFLASQLAKSHCYDISRAKRDFGYEVRVSTETGMQRLGEALEVSDPA